MILVSKQFFKQYCYSSTIKLKKNQFICYVCVIMNMDHQCYENNPGLRKYILHNVERTGVKLGAGSFGSVEEVKMAGTICAGKIWHEILLDPQNEGVDNMIQRFIKECELMSQVRHPNIV